MRTRWLSTLRLALTSKETVCVCACVRAYGLLSSAPTPIRLKDSPISSPTRPLSQLLPQIAFGSMRAGPRQIAHSFLASQQPFISPTFLRLGVSHTHTQHAG